MIRLCIILLALLSLTGMAHAEPVLDSEEHALWNLVNDYRKAHGVQPVGLNEQLTAAAEWMSGDMAVNNCSHVDSLGRYPMQRMTDFGYYAHNTWSGENIVCGADDAQGTFDLWKDSPGHDANMLSKYFWAVGIARVYDEASTYGWYWTLDFGGRGPAWFPPEPTPVPTPVLTATETPTPTPAPMPTPIAPPVPNGLPSLGTKPHE